jgi:hypothetical protein
VRGITPPAESGGDVTLLMQHQYFDGMTDCHIMLVQWTGGGDFYREIESGPARFRHCRWCAFTAP